MPEGTATDAESTEALVASLGWDVSAEEQVMVDEIDSQRDILDVDVNNDDLKSDDVKDTIPAPVDAAPETPALADQSAPAAAVEKALEAPAPVETELEAYKRIQAADAAVAERDQNVANQIAGMAKEYRDGLLKKGLSQENADEMARQAGQNAWSKYELLKVTDQSAADKSSALDKELATKYGVDAALIANFTDPAGKEAFAKTMGATNAALLEAQKLNPGVAKAPESHQDSGTGTPGAANTVQQKKQDYASGKTNLTRSEFNDLFGYWP